MERQVHIVPLGWEIDRATLPIRAWHAHRAYLLCNPDSHEEQRRSYERVREVLESEGVEVRLVRVDANDDVKGIIREVARLIRETLAEGNRVYLNMSAAGKIAAAASTLAAMAHVPRGKGIVYYVRPESYTDSTQARRRHGLSKGMKGDPVILPRFELRLPSAEGQLVLRALLLKRPEPMTYKQLIYLLRDAGVRGFEAARYEKETPRAEKNKLNVTLNKRILQKLLNEGLVELETQGRMRRVRLSGEGEYLAYLCA